MTDETTAQDEPSEETAKLLEADRDQLKSLEKKMRRAVELRLDGSDDKAREIFEEILKQEPRLAEPRLELAHMAALAARWEEAQEQARLAVDILRRDGQWTEDVEPGRLLGFALNLLGEIIVRPLEEGDLFLTDRPSFDASWNEAATMFAAALEIDPENEDARRNGTRYRPLAAQD